MYFFIKDLVFHDCGGQSKVYTANMFNRTDVIPKKVVAKEINLRDKSSLEKEVRYLLHNEYV